MGEQFSDFPWREIPSCYRIPDYHTLGKCKVDEEKRGLVFELTENEVQKLKTGTLWMEYANKAFEVTIDQNIRDRLMVFNTKVEKLNLYRPLRKDQIQAIWDLFAAAYNLKERPTETGVIPGEVDDNKDYEMDMMILGQLVTGAGHLIKKFEESDLIETLELLRNNLSSINTSDLFLNPGFLLDSLRDTHKRLMNSQGQKLLIGSWRKENVSLFKSKIVLPLHYEVEALIKFLATWCSKNYNDSLDPLIFAFEFHCRFIYIHPFSDGNGRIARLFMNLLLITSGFPPFLIAKQDKDQFCSSLQQGFWGNKIPYYTFMLGQMEKSLSLFYQCLPEEPPHPPGIQCSIRPNYSADMLSDCSYAIDFRDGNEASPNLCSSYDSGDGSYQCRGMSVDKSSEHLDEYIHYSSRRQSMRISSYGSLSDGINFLGHRGMSIDHSLGSLED